MVCLAPRARENIMRPRRLSDVLVRPLNFTVRPLRRRPRLARLIAGFIAAAGWLPLVILFQRREMWQFGFLMVLFFTVLLTLLAIPFVYLARRHLSLLVCAVFGALFGLVGAVALLAGTNPFAAPHWLIVREVASLMGLGFVSGLLFWTIGIWRNSGLTIVGGCREAQ